MAITITWSDVVALAPSLSTVEVTTQDAVLAAVALTVVGEDWGARQNLAATYLAAHLATVALRGATGAQGPLTGLTVGQVSRSFAAPPLPLGGAVFYETTNFGRAYLQVLRSIPAFRMVVL